MVASAVLVPVVTLACISVLMFVFIWWWFPRHYRKGVREDMVIMNEEQATRDALHAELGGNTEPARPKTLEEHIAIARANIRRGHNPAAASVPY